MDRPDILDHFESESPKLWPSTGLLVPTGLLLGIPAGLIHFFFYRILPPPVGIGWLKGLVLMSNQTIFMIMILSYLAPYFQLRNLRRQFTIGLGFVAGSVLTLPILILRGPVPDLFSAIRELLRMEFFYGLYLLIAFTLNLLVLILLIRRYGQSFQRAANRKSGKKN